MCALLPRQTEPSVIKEYDAQVEVIETLAAALQNSTRSLMPLTDATLTQDGITGWSGCDVIRVSLYIYTKHTRNWNRHQNAKRICWEAGDGDIAPGAEFCVKAIDQTTSRFFAGIQKTKVERIAVGM